MFKSLTLALALFTSSALAEISFPSLPKTDNIPAEFKAIAKQRKVTNLLLSFLDFHISEENYTQLKASGFKSSNLLETVADLKTYGYDVSVPSSAEEYRSKVFPMVMEMHAKAGYYGVQIPVGGVAFDENGMITENAIKLLKQQKEIVTKAGLNISAVGGSWDKDWTKCIKPQIQATNILGSPYLYGPFATPFLFFPENANSGDAAMDWVDGQIERFSNLLTNEIGPFAAKYDVTLCEEPLQRFERMPIHLNEATQIALKAKTKQFKVMVDMCHEFTDGAGPKKFKELIQTLHKADKLHGIHVSPIHRGKLYESWFNQQYFNDFFGAFFEVGYTGEVSIETFDATAPVAVPAKVNRRKFKNPIGVMINQLVYTADKLSKVPVK